MTKAEIVVLHAESWLMVARMIVDVSDSHTTLTTLLRFEHPAARHVWAFAEPGIARGGWPAAAIRALIG